MTMSSLSNSQNDKTPSADQSSSGAEPQIPQPPTHFLLGNIPDIEAAAPAESFYKLSKIYGPIFQLDFKTEKRIIIASYEYWKDVCDESRFEKTTVGNLDMVRNILGDGLFTARSNEAVRRPKASIIIELKHYSELGRSSSYLDAIVWSTRNQEDVSANDGHRLTAHIEVGSDGP